jgi:hypothetical protein
LLFLFIYFLFFIIPFHFLLILIARHEGKTSELLANLSTFSNVPKARIAIGAVRDQKLCRLFTPQTKLGDLSDIIYAFETIAPMPYLEDEGLCLFEEN